MRRVASTSTATASPGCRYRADTWRALTKKCKGSLNGPTVANGRHCPEGWTLHQFPGPQFENVSEPGAVQSSYYTWVDQFDTLGLGRNVPIATGNMSDALE